jgi:YjbE family integral membrane protein
MSFSDAGFWVALMQIIGVNIVLSGDNAVVIALAARSLPPKQQKQAVLWGSGAAVVMRIVLTVVAVQLLTLPYLKLIGAALLLWIGVQLLLPEDEEEGEGEGGKANTGMVAAIRTILIADLVMSLDNVIAVAAAAKGSLTLLILGLLISIPLVIFGSTLLMKVMERWPIIITIGGALLGWVAGEMAITDPAVKDWIDANAAWLHYAAPVLGAVLVVAVGKFLSRRSAEHEIDRPIVDLASASDQHPSTAAAGVTSRVLLVADDTPPSLRGVSRFVDEMRANAGKVAVDLLNVQAPVSRDVSNFVEEGAIKGHHHDEGMKAIEPARAALEQAGVPCVVHIGVGDFTHVVLHYAKTLGSTKMYLTDTAREEGDDLTAATTHMSQHSNLPVTVLR